MEELEIPFQYRVVVHRLCEEVKVKIRTSTDISESFRDDIRVKQGFPLSPTLFGLYIDKLEEWLNLHSGDGVRLGEFVITLPLYADDLVLIAKSAHGFQMHLYALKNFCKSVGMQVNTSKNKIMIFSNKRDKSQHTFFFEGNILEEINENKYLRIDFKNKLNLEYCRKKRILGGWKALYALQKICRKVELWDWKTIKVIFGLLVFLMILYGCELWASNIHVLKWKQIEKIQKRLIMSKFKIESSVPYEIMLSETRVAPNLELQHL